MLNISTIGERSQ